MSESRSEHDDARDAERWRLAVVRARRLVYIVALELGAFFGGWAVGKPGNQFPLALIGGLSMGTGIAWAVGLYDRRSRNSARARRLT